MLRLFLFALLSLSGIAQADTMLRFDKGVVEVGDKTGRVLTIAGKPDRIVPIENKFGATIGERWDYYSRGKTYQVFIDKDGTVADLESQ